MDTAWLCHCHTLQGGWNPMNEISVLIADDDAHIRTSLRLLVEDEPDMTVSAVAADGSEAVDCILKHQPHVALMDVRMPRMTGLEAAAILAARQSSTRLVMLTTFDMDDYVYQSLRHGASGFLLKNAPLPDILKAIRTAHEGNALLAPEVTRRLIDRFTLRPAAHHRLSELTVRERETLTLIGQGASNSEIATALFLTRTTVRTYVSRILTKLGARDRAQLVVIAYEGGLVGP